MDGGPLRTGPQRSRAHRASVERTAELAEEFPLRRIGQPEDVAVAALFLASAAASWTTGITFDVGGGRIMV